jgi:hypothetical protein
MLSSLTPLVRPLTGSASASATTDSAAPPAPAGSAASAAADRGPSGASTSPSVGAYVPPLARGSDAGATAAGGRAAASAAYAEHGGEDGDAASGDAAASDGVARSEAGRWMSASVTQPNAPSFSEATAKLQQGEAAITADRRASLDYLVSSMKRMQAAAPAQPAGAGSQDATPAMRYATAAYIEF